jgi:N-acetylglucosaminyl-diphospho-decaprenol L-rhamnosyltransferase
VSRIAVVIVNYRTADLVIDCLRSLAVEVRRHGDCRVVIVDNCSADGSVVRIRAALEMKGWDNWAELLPLEENRGFAAGNNAALRRLLQEPRPPHYYWLLNPDTIVRPGALQALVDFLTVNPQVGIAGSALEDLDGTTQRSAFRFPTIASELERGARLGALSRLLRRYLVAPPCRREPHSTDWISGASMMVRRAVFDSVGLLDEGYFLYYEETDFCRKAQRGGWQCWYVPSSCVVHLIGQSTGVKDQRPTTSQIPAYLLESRRRYFSKNHGLFYRLAADAAWLLGFLGWRLRRRLQRKPDLDPPGLLKVFLRDSLRTLSFFP